MSLLKSWSDSLVILYPSNLKLFLLVTLNSIRQAFRVWSEVVLGNFWIFFFVLYSWMRLVVYDRPDSIFPYPYGLVLELGYSILVIFIAYLTLRSSVRRKTFHYFLSYYKHFFYFFVVSVSVRFLLCGTQVNYNSISYAILIGVSLVVLFLWMHAFSILFFLDSPAGLSKYARAAYNGMKMILYNLPFVLFFMLFIMYVFFPVFNSLIQAIDFFMPDAFHDHGFSIFWFRKLLIKSFLKVLLTFVYMVKALVPLAIYTNFYIKKMHEQFNLYK